MSATITAVSVDFYSDTQGHGVFVTITSDGGTWGIRADHTPNLSSDLFNAGYSAWKAAQAFRLDAVNVTRESREGVPLMAMTIPVAVSATQFAADVSMAGDRMVPVERRDMVQVLRVEDAR